ncbi:MAG: MerR family transcriptional regulator [Ignavibacteria bacterium]|nr:MerR family transcriptional regulator [Ignavibacteria bacterium]
MEKMSANTKPTYSIGTVSRMLGVSVHTLRMYEREGLIIPHKSDGNHRLYSPADVDRLNCIRRAILEEKISIAGIRRIQALIPCWDIKQCSEEDRSHCKAFRSHERGCWTYKHKKNMCAELDCRTCDVYESAIDCGNIKQRIIELAFER